MARMQQAEGDLRQRTSRHREPQELTLQEWPPGRALSSLEEVGMAAEKQKARVKWKDRRPLRCPGGPHLRQRQLPEFPHLQKALITLQGAASTGRSWQKLIHIVPAQDSCSGAPMTVITVTPVFIRTMFSSSHLS